MSNTTKLDAVVVQISDKVSTQVTGFFVTATGELTQELALQVARDLGYVKTNKGRQGGYSPTDEGLTFVGVDKAKYEAEINGKRDLTAIEKKIANLEKKKSAMLNGTADMPEVTPTANHGANALEA